jgi:hypothetical protein
VLHNSRAASPKRALLPAAGGRRPPDRQHRTTRREIGRSALRTLDAEGSVTPGVRGSQSKVAHLVDGRQQHAIRGDRPDEGEFVAKGGCLARVQRDAVGTPV